MLLSSQIILVHFDLVLPIVLSCDASADGISAMLSYNFADGLEKPIAFVSRTLTDAEKKYSQIVKEWLACIVRVPHFHTYLLGHKFTLLTYNKVLMLLFDSYRYVSPQVSGRIQCWCWWLCISKYYSFV